ncbi:MAG: hypothetical protein LLG02_15215 [Pelosinus sp.]|nr:hypothetical protein [Pelosinus sp.]
MRKSWILFILLIVFICTGCGTSVKSDLEEYIKFDNSISREFEDYRSDLMEQSKEINNRREEAQLLATYTSSFAAIKEKQKQYKPKTKKVQEIHKKAVQATEDTIDTINEYIAAVEADTLDERSFNSLRDKLQAAKSLSTEYHNDIIALRKNE